jgi:predicted nucleotide-binding protein (sugar kinase/HSP70/actin superfamily)
MDYIPAEFLEKVKAYLENYRKAKEIFEELCSICRELLRRRERF